MVRVVNVADVVDRSDPQGRTFRQVNAAREHAIPLGALVELDSGARLFVVTHDRDCDMTPLYGLYYKPCAPAGIWPHNLIRGFAEESLTPIAQIEAAKVVS